MDWGRTAAFVKEWSPTGPAGERGKWRRGLTNPLDRSRQTCEFDEMAKFRSSYVCQNCGAITQRWAGKCESCGEWNTIIEEAAALGVGGAAARRGAAGRPFPLAGPAGAGRARARPP